MDRYAVFRENLLEDRDFIAALEAAGAIVADVADFEDLEIDFVASTGSYSARFCGIDVDHFKGVMFFGWPFMQPCVSASEDDRFAHAERLATAQALFEVMKPQIFNVKYSFYDNGLMTLSAQLRCLAKIGWETPIVECSIVGTRPPEKLLTPDPGSGHKLSLVITRTSCLIFPAGEAVRASGYDFWNAVNVTKRFVRRLGYDWITVLVCTFGQRCVAYGMTNHLPPDMQPEQIRRLLADSLPAQAPK